MSGLGVRKRLIMAHKITGSVAYEWKCAGEPCFTVVSSLFLKASSPEARERNKPIRAVLYGCGRCRQSRSHHVWFVGNSVYPVFQNSLSPSWKTAKDMLVFITRILSAHSQLLGALTWFLACLFSEQWGTMLFSALPQCLESVATRAVVQEIQMEALPLQIYDLMA